MSRFKLLRTITRKVFKAAYWLVTPWRMPHRIQFLRERAERNAKARWLALLVDGERARLEGVRLDNTSQAADPFDLYDPLAAYAAVELQHEKICWPTMKPGDVLTDRRVAALYIMESLRARKDLRARFPLALSEAQPSAFAHWLLSSEGRAEMKVTENEAAHLVALLAEDFGARARQFFMTSEEIRSVFPHGLMSSGRRSLFSWFMWHGLLEGGLLVEEVWWLFLQAAEDPQAERVRAFLFTPEWQRRFPDALTVFGWHPFSHWLDKAYGPEDGMKVSVLPSELPEAAVQLRIAYKSHAAWQAAHPEALSDPDATRELIEWLAYCDDALVDQDARRWCAALDIAAVVPRVIAGGINVVGHFCYPSGLRVSVEAMVKAANLVGIHTSLRDVRTDARDDPAHVRFHGQECGDITIIHVQPEPFFTQAYDRADLAESQPRTYRVAYWYWEFDSIPEAWIAHANAVDEVWTATEFIADALRKRLSIPVRTLFPGVNLAPFQVRDRSYFKLEPDRFVFLFAFHMMSVMERKNPLGLVRAFKQAFRAGEPVRLVLKTSFGERHPAQLRELLDAAEARPDITVIDDVFSADDLLALMNTCDAYVSLHRSEGLGLTMAEAMLLGKPVIATAFSGNMDFMNDENSLLVRSERVKVGQSIPPYEAELEWAEPSVEHAAQLMRRLFEDRQWAYEVGECGRRSAESTLSLEAAGQRIARRLEEIAVLKQQRVR
jgi:glycosyltransferase involved in cell wall biosynthesis